ncbi:MAG: hypothetical protein M3Y03_05910 [Verrucomicrobiota bacterium]|nr:hypothetical protein [Verrucomicrobiota bacterium]
MDARAAELPCARGTCSALLRAMVTVIAPRNAAQVQTEVAIIKKAGSKVNKSKKSARAFLLKHGFITKDNKVGKDYR